MANARANHSHHCNTTPTLLTVASQLALSLFLLFLLPFITAFPFSYELLPEKKPHIPF